MKIALAARTLSGSARHRFVERLLTAGADVSILVDDHTDGATFNGMGIRIVTGAPDDVDALREVARDADVLVWRLPVPGDCAALRALWKRSIDALVDTVVLQDVRHVVHLSHYGAWKKTGSALVDTVAEAERRLDDVTIHVTHLRAGFLLENLMAQLPTLRANHSIYLPMLPSNELPVVGARRVADAAADHALRTELSGRTVLDVDDGTLSMRDLLDRISVDQRAPIAYEQMIASAARAFFESLERSPSWARHMVDLFVQTDRGNVVQEHGPRRLREGALASWAQNVLHPQLETTGTSQLS